MQRLTDKYSDGTPFIPNYILQTTNGMSNAIKKLSEYEDLEENGLLLKLPCKEGDIVFVVGTKCLADIVSDDECDDIPACEVCPYDKEYVVFTREVTQYFLSILLFYKNCNFVWGKTVFSSEEEANKELNNRQ